MPSFSKTILIFLVFFTMISIALFFRETMLSAAIEWVLKDYCRQCFGSEVALHIERIEKKDGAWVINKSLVTKENQLGIQEKQFSADQIVINYTINWFRRQLDLDITMTNPQGDIWNPQSLLEGLDLANMQQLNKQSSFSDLSVSNLGFFRLKGKIEIDQGTLTLHRPKSPDKQLYFQFNGDWSSSLKGRMVTWLQTPHSSSNFIELMISPSNEESTRHILVNCHSIECSSLCAILHAFKPSLTEWTATEGIIDGEFTITLPKDKKMYLEGDLHLQQLVYHHVTMPFQGTVPAAHLQLTKPCQTDPLSPAPIGKIELSQPASLQFLHSDSSCLAIQNITGEALLQPGTAEIILHGTCYRENKIFHPSSIGKNDSDLIGDVQMRLSTSEGLISLLFVGNSQNLTPLLPEQFIHAVRKKFPQNSISITANIDQTPSGAQIDGVLVIADEAATNSEKVHFNFALEKSDASLSPPLDQPHQLGLSALYPLMITKGSFHGVDLPLDKYVAPFIFTKEQLQLSGRGNCRGTFDPQGLTLQYDVHDLLLDSAYFTLNVKNFASNEMQEENKEYPANHYFQFATGKHKGVIPLCNATYLEKNSGLLFTDLQTNITIEREHVQAANVETFCKGIYFAGSVDLDFEKNGKGIVDVDILTHTMYGNFSQFQSLLAHFKQPFFPLIGSLEGNVALQQQESSLHFTLQPNGVQVAAHVQGTLSEGTATSPNLNLAIQDLNFNFAYDHQASTLECSDIQGTLLVGTRKNMDEYTIAGDHVRFTDYARQCAEFDLWVGDRNRDVVRLTGKTVPVIQGSEEASYIEVQLDHQLSHFGNVYPSAFQLFLKDWVRVEKFHLQFAFQLDTLLRDLQRFSKTGLLFLSQGLFKELNALKTARGDFKINCHYDHDTSLLTYQADGHDVSIGTYQFNKCLLHGKKIDSKWSIEQLQLDDLSFAADVTSGEKKWILNFLGIQCGHACLLGLEGEYFPEDHLLKTKVNLLEANLAHLKEWPRLQDFISTYNLKGEVRATGHINAKWLDLKPAWHLETVMNAAVRGCEVQGIQFQDAENIKCEYSSSQGISLSHIQTAIKGNDKKSPALINIDKLDYDLSNKAFVLNGLNFNIPAVQLPWLTTFLQKQFPETLSSKSIQILSQSKPEGNLIGSLNFTISPQHKNFSLKLKEGRYRLWEKDYDLSNFVVECNPFEFCVSTDCHYKQHLYELSLRSALPALEAGEFSISDQIPSKFPLRIHWQSHPQSGIFIQDVQGSCTGLTVNLQRPREALPEITHLIGNVRIDAKETIPFSSEELDATLAALNLKGIYNLNGDWFLKNWESPNSLTWIDALQFKGNIEGAECELKGYQLEHLSSQIEYTPQKITCKDFRINDAAGTLHAENVQLHKDQRGDWIVNMPSLAVRQFRPSLLRGVDPAAAAEHSTFLVRQLDLQEFTGVLSKPTTYRGKGIAHCQNPHKQELFNEIADLSSDKLSNFDVEMALFHPVSGTIQYEIEQEKVYLTKLKEVYSTGKLAKFYLPAHSPARSYINFKGDISIQARIKQRNLLFKFAELFTVSVKGTLLNPTYTFIKSRNNPPS